MPIDPPTSAVVEAFGRHGAPRPLAGGQGDSFVVDGAVLKPAFEVEVAAWTQALAERLEPRGFRVARPLPATSGSWVHDSWTACELVPELTPAAPDWATVVAAGRSFVQATDALIDEVPGLDLGVLSRRTHRWARADRCAWGEEDVSLGAQAQQLLLSLRALLGTPSPERRIIHADLSGNVHLDREGVPVILDLSPYLRPAAWGEAIVIADAVTWWHEPPALAASFVAAEGGRDLLARALIFRLVAEQLGGAGDDPTMLAPYERIVARLTD